MKEKRHIFYAVYEDGLVKEELKKSLDDFMLQDGRFSEWGFEEKEIKVTED